MLHPACVLDASLTVAEAVQRLRVHGGLRFALVRRQRGVRVSWHAFERSGLLRTLSEMPPERSLEEAGTEHRLFAEPEEVLQAKRVTRRQTDSSRAVLLDGDRLLGWLQPEGATERGGAHPVPSGEERRTSVPASSTGAGDVEYFRGGEEVVRASGARSPRWFADGEPVPPSARTSDAFYGFPRLIAPTSVSAGERFEVTVGLANRPVRGVAGTAVVIRDLAPGTREIELEVQVVAEGFAAPEGWRHPLRIVLAEPEAAELRVPLIALETTRETRLGCIDVHFSHLGVPCGSARRHVAIRGAGTPDAGSGTGQIWTRSRAAVGELRVPFGEAAPDLTVWITKPDGNPASGRLAWSFSSPHDLDLPGEPLVTDLGRDPATFARSLVRMLGDEDGGELAAELMEGLGDTIRHKVPPELWSLLRQVWTAVAATGELPPAVLLLSAEEYVPWELALVDPALDPGRPPFLGAQVAVGRWILDPAGPPIPPPHTIQVPDFAVVTACYPPGGEPAPLPAAVREARELAREHRALPVALRAREIKELLGGALEKGGRPAQVGALHFACHGSAGSGDPRADELVMEDGSSLNPLVFRRAKVARANPFLFLNACQVGQTGEMLGMVGGFAGHCLYGGFHGFVAPFWSIMDDLAGQIAVEFYRSAFGADGRRRAPVAEILRDLRQLYGSAGEPVRLTPLAYVFYGHPKLILERGRRTAASSSRGITARRGGSPPAPPEPLPAPSTDW